ncbi:hybrid sensor histidine kinase/response regulator [Rugamonas apoptosis]|uniref:histidine kinase n=1 Tax=Rugamonas apoptosis TaxID=2758570 RepID=A0A7W2FET6_9BURK|nr:hybrid sensor histidine kinase/response regulator [Rugamonas apoptosis]MBA5690279.1 hybrid sensor histidine kinase/response regulator [Rugamonas apoptosis]
MCSGTIRPLPDGAVAGIGGPLPVPVLLVDDRRENLAALAALLADFDLGLELVCAESGNEALRLSLRHEFALVLMDVQMPDMNGMETATLLRANPKTRQLPIVFVTAGMAEQPHQFAGYELGAVDYLIKPIEPVVLRSKVTVFCELYRHRRYQEALVAERTAELSALARELGEEVRARRAAEQTLLQLNEELEQRIDLRTGELRRAMEQIVESEKLASLGGIVAGVAHELNTPLGNIMLVATALDERFGAFAQTVQDGQLTRSVLAKAVADFREASALLLRSAGRASELIESFKAVAVDQTSARRRIFDVRATVTDILNSLGTSLRHAQVRTVVQIPDGIRMDSYPGALEQVISNLISNSIIHGFDGKGGEIVIDGRQLGAKVELEYRDNGVGIAPELQHKVFEPFYTTRLGQGGSGLGMFIVHNLTHGTLRGEIRIHSQLGAGVAVTLTLPAVAPA